MFLELVTSTLSYFLSKVVHYFVTGVINHSREVLAFIDLHQWGHDSNFTINIPAENSKTNAIHPRCALSTNG